MSFSGAGLSYAFLLVPSLIALVVIMQGFQKLGKHEPDGGVAIGFGIFFLGLIATAYFMYIK